MRKPPETLDTACYTANRNRKGHRSPDQHDRFQAWTVSSCSPHIVVIPRGWLLLVGTGFSRSNDGRNSGASSNEGASPDVARAFSVPCRHSWRHSVRPEDYVEEDHPPAAVFALLVEGGCMRFDQREQEAPLKKSSGKCKAGLNKAGTRLKIRHRVKQSRTMATNPSHREFPRGRNRAPQPSPRTPKSPKPLHFLQKTAIRADGKPLLGDAKHINKTTYLPRQPAEPLPREMQVQAPKQPEICSFRTIRQRIRPQNCKLQEPYNGGATDHVTTGTSLMTQPNPRQWHRGPRGGLRGPRGSDGAPWGPCSRRLAWQTSQSSADISRRGCAAPSE